MFNEMALAIDTRLTHVEIVTGGLIVRGFDTSTVPLPGEHIHWGGKYRVEVLTREWVIDTDINPRGRPRCVLVCKKISWPKKGK